MAGDWIKVENTLPNKREVLAIAGIVGIDPDAVVGKLVRFWIWADENTIDGNAASVTSALVDRYLFCTGFADAMVSVGWLKFSGGFIRIPNFDHHNGQTGKKRALTARRVAKHKRSSNGQGNVASVTGALPRGEEEEEILRISSDPTSTPLGGPLEGAVDFDSVFENHHVCATLKRKLPPASEQDRRFYAKLAVLVDRGLLLPAWVNEACASTSEKRRKKPIAFFTGCLRNRCREEHGADLKSLLSQVEFSTNGKTP